MNNYKKTVEDLEKEFDTFFEEIGFQRLINILGPSPTIKNADYCNRELKITVELKILSKDHFENGGVIDRFHSFIPVAQNIDEKGEGLYKIKLPKINREGKYDTLEEPLRKIIKTANRQLRETNQFLYGQHGTGLLLIAVHGMKSLHPNVLYQMIQGLLSEEFKSIAGFILVYPTWALYDKKGVLVHPLCFNSMHISSQTFQIHQCDQICEYWLRFMGNKGHKNLSL